MPLRPVSRDGDGFDLREMASKEYRFPIQGVPAMRLPKGVTRFADLLAAAGPDVSLCWTALTNPVHRVPLLAPAAQRRAALLVACTTEDKVTVTAVTLGVRPGPRRHSPPEIVEQHVDIVRGQEEIFDLLERVWADADPAAQAAVNGAPALWLGGDPAATLSGGATRVAGVCATFDLQAEIVRNASRHSRQIAARIGAAAPSYLIVWRPEARGVDPATTAFRGASAEGVLIELDEPVLADALLELRWKLADFGLADSEPKGGAQPATPPAAGEERFYIKHHGSKVGDVMIEVNDCGHGQWGSNVQRLAPRAYKGIAAGVQARPQALFRCAKCSKHRWRARY
jgi:hypothetical protein